ncbi:hypothetical protein BC829DRAFT_402095 [Chytridium lagenaria]|nr:hypothetical protein BC829DRAFT_402095 [Chytridium lagenaria]
MRRIQGWSSFISRLSLSRVFFLVPLIDLSSFDLAQSNRMRLVLVFVFLLILPEPSFPPPLLFFSIYFGSYLLLAIYICFVERSNAN